MEGQINGWIDKWIEKQMEGQINGWIDKWMDR